MKNKLTLLIVLLSVLTLSISAQEREREKQRNRLEQLERVKLIEVLDLNEENSVRFFSRRNNFRNEIESLERKSEEVLNRLEHSLRSEENDAESGRKKMINEIIDLSEKIELKKKQFILSLGDILSTEQTARYIVFEKRFREEIRKILLDRKKNPR